ncbi:MAG: FkbM family methyltransferase [Anaerolineales bacterium]|nr:FkbM family methyltransferase [Anaerolineales bacterium]
MRRFYGQFIHRGALCFDIGAHVGNRLAVWTTLGADVVGVEPAPECQWLLQRLFGRNRRVTLVDAAMGAAPGQQTLFVSERNPTVTSLSSSWIATVQRTDAFAGVRWEGAVTVPVTTLDDLIDRYGAPAFCKIDVEGYELEVLSGLSRPLNTLSFEYVAPTRDLAIACIIRLAQLGNYVYNASPGEQHRWQFAEWMAPPTAIAWLQQLGDSDGSGDIYARRLG